MHEGRKQTNTWRAYAGSRLELTDALGRRRPKCHPSSRTGEKPAVRNDRGDRGDVGIIRSPVRASILPDCRTARLRADGTEDRRYRPAVDEYPCAWQGAPGADAAVVEAGGRCTARLARHTRAGRDTRGVRRRSW